MLTIKSISPGSVAEQIGLRPGDSLVSVDGHPVGDVIDVHFYAAADTVEVRWQTPAGEARREGVDVGPEGLGLEFTQPTADGIRICNNRCVFCFVDQSPARMRRTLYIKDDDFRYSFLAANFVTLTNLSAADWEKIREQHLSPLYVSVHATEPEVRRRLLGNPTAPDIREQIDLLASWGIKLHTQVVLTPGWNDGPHLRRTVEDLAARWPAVQSLAVVPVGLTRQRFDRQEGLRRRLEENLARPDLDPVHRSGLQRRTASAPELRLVSAGEARALVRWARPLQRDFERRFGHTWLYLSDEVYLLAGRPVPGALRYDGFVQLENGIGMVRSLLDDWRKARQTRPRGGPPPARLRRPGLRHPDRPHLRADRGGDVRRAQSASQGGYGGERLLRLRGHRLRAPHRAGHPARGASKGGRAPLRAPRRAGRGGGGLPGRDDPAGAPGGDPGHRGGSRHHRRGRPGPPGARHHAPAGAGRRWRRVSVARGRVTRGTWHG